MKSWLYLSLGWANIGLGIIGVVVPLLPTTPFLLLASFCFARGSNRVHAWLMDHPHLGPPIHEWRKHRAISRRAKWSGTLAMLAVLGLSALLQAPKWILGLQAAALAAIGSFLWTRPSMP